MSDSFFFLTSHLFIPMFPNRWEATQRTSFVQAPERCDKYCMLVVNHPNHAPLTSGIKALQSTTSCSNLPGELQKHQGLIFTLNLSFFTQLLPSFGSSHMMLLIQPIQRHQSYRCVSGEDVFHKAKTKFLIKNRQTFT